MMTNLGRHVLCEQKGVDNTTRLSVTKKTYKEQ